jgi:hypothetical protein
VLGHPDQVEWSLESDGLRVELPPKRPSEFGVTVRINVAPTPPAERRVGFHL